MPVGVGRWGTGTGRLIAPAAMCDFVHAVRRCMGVGVFVFACFLGARACVQSLQHRLRRTLMHAQTHTHASTHACSVRRRLRNLTCSPPLQGDGEVQGGPRDTCPEGLHRALQLATGQKGMDAKNKDKGLIVTAFLGIELN